MGLQFYQSCKKKTPPQQLPITLVHSFPVYQSWKKWIQHTWLQFMPTRHTIQILCAHSVFPNNTSCVGKNFCWENFSVYQVCLRHRWVWDQLTFIVSTGWFLFGDIDEAVCRMTYNSFNYPTSTCQDQPRKGSRKRRASKASFSCEREDYRTCTFILFFLLEVSVHICIG